VYCILKVCVICLGGIVRSHHPPIPIGMDMNDLSVIARFRGHPYPPGPRQFDMYHRSVGPRVDAQQMYSVCPDSQPSYQVCCYITALNSSQMFVCVSMMFICGSRLDVEKGWRKRNCN